MLASRYNNHMIGNKNMLFYLGVSITSRITLRDRSCIKVEGKCIVHVITTQNKQKYMSNVYYVPHMKHNIIIVGQLMEHGYDVIF